MYRSAHFQNTADLLAFLNAPANATITVVSIMPEADHGYTLIYTTP